MVMTVSWGMVSQWYAIPPQVVWCSFSYISFPRTLLHISRNIFSEAGKKFTKTKSDYGDIIDLIPVQRGPSGRICKLKIVGTLKTLTIGKEMEIRRTLSDSHLFSSAFVVDKGEIKEGIPQWFLLSGAGWGHGVGLCQIGAAVMGEKGYSYEEILLHYYKGAEIRKFY